MTTKLTPVEERNFSLLMVVLLCFLTVFIFVLVARSSSPSDVFVISAIWTGMIFMGFCERLAKANQLLGELSQPKSRCVEDRFDELERLKRRDLVTPEEYAAKRQEILKDL